MKLILIILIIIVSFFILMFIIGFVLAAFSGSSKRRRAHAIILLSQLPEYQIDKLINILFAHRNKNIKQINSLVGSLGTDAKKQIIKTLAPENRPIEFSSGRFGDALAWTSMENGLREKGYNDDSSRIITGIILNDLDNVLMELEKSSKYMHR